jgi:5'-3' exoribonuclease 1
VGGDRGWEDVRDGINNEDESRAAVDRALKKYGKVQDMNDDERRGFDAQYERSIREKVDEWKRGYYKVLYFVFQVRRVLMGMYV